MTARRTFSRSLAAFSAILSLATWVAMTAAPSTARAETRTQNIVSEFPLIGDQDGLSFSDVAAEVQGNRIVITAQVVMTGTAGKPRTGSVVFSAFMDYSDDARLMDYTDDACMPSLMSRQAGDQACAAISRALRDVAPTVPAAEGIIMRDGGICDPIRHIGC